MNTQPSKKPWPRVVLLMTLPLMLMLACSLVYSLNVIRLVRAEGVYASPQEGVTQRAYRYFLGVTKIDIQSARVNAHNGSNPHIWYVIYQIYADRRTDGSPLYANRVSDHVNGANYYMHMKDGWVYVPDLYMPEMIGIWMKVLGLAAP